ncbi:nuclease-related domain-containing protein [Alkalibacterium putridalgicola]|uniref:nuclease-related domain-containing protein n=1 Tax=Alkalibacterium putridalgicola TaxID=426703 RepID=UPI0034CE8CD2
MLLKQREKSKIHLGLLALDKRMVLEDTDRNYLLNLERGYKGEELFDDYVKQYLTKEVIVLNDLLLTSRGSSFQVDSVIITSDTLYMYEIKNYKGNYQMNAGQIVTLTGQEINNPVNQINRAKTLMKQMVKDFGYGIKVDASVIFVNPTFYLYDAKTTVSFIYPNQIEKHFNDMNNRLTPLTKEQQYLAQKLIQENRESVPYQKELPDFEYSKLKKTIYCSLCGKDRLRVTRKRSYCTTCQHQQGLEKTILEHIAEFKLLFPNEKVTVQLLYDWCGGKASPRRLRKVCGTHYKKIGTTSNSYYD